MGLLSIRAGGLPSRLARLVACLLLLGCAPQAQARAVRVEERVRVNGAALYLMTRGASQDLPVMIWLHGGPGGAERPLFRLYNAPLERRLIVAYLDQRGAGRSFDPAADPKQLTVARHIADLDAVVDHLRRRYGRDKVILVGHSWGATLGLLYAQAHPEKVAAFAGVGQPVNEVARQRAQYDFVLAEARRRNEPQVLARIAQIGPPPYSADREIATQRIVERYGGYFHRQPSFPLVLMRGVAGGHIAPWELARFFRGNEVSLEAMNDEALRLDLAASTPAVSVPVIFMLGRHDRQVDSRLAAAYFETLQAPQKRLQWFEESAHNPPFEEPEAFNAALLRLLAQVGAISADGTGGPAG